MNNQDFQEMLFLSQEQIAKSVVSELEYDQTIICEIIDDCIVDDIGISTYDMCLADYQFLLHIIL